MDTIQSWLSQFSSLLGKHCGDLCSNISLQEGNSSVQNNSPGFLTVTKNNMGLRFEKGINWVQTNHTIKLNGIPEKKHNKRGGLGTYLKMFIKLQWLFAILIYSHAE